MGLDLFTRPVQNMLAFAWDETRRDLGRTGDVFEKFSKYTLPILGNLAPSTLLLGAEKAMPVAQFFSNNSDTWQRSAGKADRNELKLINEDSTFLAKGKMFGYSPYNGLKKLVLWTSTILTYGSTLVWLRDVNILNTESISNKFFALPLTSFVNSNSIVGRTIIWITGNDLGTLIGRISLFSYGFRAILKLEMYLDKNDVVKVGPDGYIVGHTNSDAVKSAGMWTFAWCLSEIALAAAKSKISDSSNSIVVKALGTATACLQVWQGRANALAPTAKREVKLRPSEDESAQPRGTSDSLKSGVSVSEGDRSIPRGDATTSALRGASQQGPKETASKPSTTQTDAQSQPKRFRGSENPDSTTGPSST